MYLNVLIWFVSLLITSCIALFECVMYRLLIEVCLYCFPYCILLELYESLPDPPAQITERALIGTPCTRPIPLFLVICSDYLSYILHLTLHASFAAFALN